MGLAIRHGDIGFHPHIHLASEKAMIVGKKPESDAQATDRFQYVASALICLAEDFRVIGLNPEDTHPRLF